MTLDDALNELGIDRNAGADEARRAYLRLLKKRKPEVDRDGFMRLREAYELAKPYFEHLDMIRAVETAANEASSGGEGAPEVVRIETPAGVILLHRSAPRQTATDEGSVPEKPRVVDEPAEAKSEVAAPEEVVPAQDSPLEASSPLEEAPVAAQSEVIAEVPDAPVVEPPTNAAPEPPEPTIEQLITAGKLKKAARRMGREFRESMQQGIVETPVSSPHDALMLLLRLHEKNRVEEARALEKDFADWLAATGVSVRLMAGEIGVVWLMTRELSAVSNKFPSELREGIAKSLIAGKFDEIPRRASWFQISDPKEARNAALDLHAHAPTLARMLADILAPQQVHASPGASSSGPRGTGTWGIGIVLVALLNLVRLCGSSQDTMPRSYSGKSDPVYYRPSPANPPALTPEIFTDFLDGGLPVEEARTFDSVTRILLVNVVNQIESAAEKKATQTERFMVQRARYLRSSINSGNCRASEADLEQLVVDLSLVSDSLKADILPHAKKIDQTLRTACGRQSAAKPSTDGGTKKP